MRGDFGAFVNEKRKGRAPGGGDVLLRDLANAMGGISVSYLSDILKGRRNPPDYEMQKKISKVLHLSPEEEEEMFYLAGRETESVAPDLPDYIMDEDLPHVRAALRKANKKGLGDDFWKHVADEIDKSGDVNE